jgi:predicted  nucleic acid-binding Zn-ribbon protein
MDKQQEEKSNNRNGLVLLLLLLLGSIGFNVYQYKNHTTTIISHGNEVDSLTNVRIEVERELVSTSMELDKYRGIAGNLDSLLTDANGKIYNQELKIRNLLKNEKDANKLSKKLKEELASLKELRDEYLEKIDALMIENGALKAKNTELTEAVSGLSQEKSKLEKTVEAASVLKVEYVKVSVFKKKSNGKLVETTLAKRTNKIEACLTIMDNKVANKGDRFVYLRVISPSGKPLAGINKGNISVNGETLECTSNIKIDYQNEKQNICLAYEGEERNLESGTYTIELYIDNNLVHASNYILK